MACLINITKDHLEPQLVYDVAAVTDEEADFRASFTASNKVSNHLEEPRVIFSREYGLFLIGGYFDKLPTSRVYNLKISGTYTHWEHIRPGLSMARVFHSAVLTSDLIVVSGGQDENKKAMRTVEMACLGEPHQSLEWYNTFELNVSRYDHCMIEYNFQFYVIGGKDNKGNYLKSVEKFNPDADTYWKICGIMSSPRAGFSAVRKHSLVYLIGGKRDDKTEINSISILNLTTIQTTIIANMPPELNSIVAGLDLGQDYIYVIGRKSNNPKHLEVPSTIPSRRLKAVDLIHGVAEPTLEASTSAMPDLVAPGFSSQPDEPHASLIPSEWYRSELVHERCQTSAMPDIVVPGFSSQMDEPHTSLITSERDTSEMVHYHLQRLALQESLSPGVERTKKSTRPSQLARSVVTWATRKVLSKSRRDPPQVTSPSKKLKTVLVEGRKEEKEEIQSSRLCRSEEPSKPTCSTGLSGEELDMYLPESAECEKPQSYETTASKTFTTRLQSPAPNSEMSKMLTSEEAARQPSIELSSSNKGPRLPLKKEFPQRKSTHTLPSEDEKAMLEEGFAEEKELKSHDLVMRYDLERSDWDKDFSVPYYRRSERWSLVCAEKPYACGRRSSLVRLQMTSHEMLKRSRRA